MYQHILVALDISKEATRVAATAKNIHNEAKVQVTIDPKTGEYEAKRVWQVPKRNLQCQTMIWRDLPLQISSSFVSQKGELRPKRRGGCQDGPAQHSVRTPQRLEPPLKRHPATGSAGSCSER